MSYWDGTRWIDSRKAPSATTSRRANWAATAVMVAGFVALVLPFAATSAATHRRGDPPCTVTPSPATVDSSVALGATGLPTVDPVWLTVQPPSGSGSVSEVYVDQSTGTWSGSEFVNQAGTWTYTFSGLLWNRKYGTVASCSVNVN
jgi:hypothetical protein